ncbi:MAG: restriction endonuclease subunit S [Bacteroidia bacterium]|nr:restriction endonuclease subunit S [Bacteroidia bacterium]
MGSFRNRIRISEILNVSKIITYGIVQPGSHDPKGVYMIRSQDYSRGWSDLGKMYRVSAEVDRPYERSRVRSGDILITVVGANIGKIAVVPETLDGANISRSVARISVNSRKANSTFVKLLLESQVEKLVYVNQVGGAQPVLNLKDLGKFEIPYPSLKEQSKIAEILSTWDEAIEQTQKLIEQLKQRKKGLMQQLLTGKKRLKGFSGEWGSVKMKDLFEEVRDRNDGGDHEPLTISAKSGFISQKMKFDKIIAGSSLSKYIKLQKGDFSYNKGNSKTYQMGCVFLLEKFDTAVVPFVYISFRKKGGVHNVFYKHWFAAHGLDRQLKAIITSGARGDGLLNVNKRDFFNLIVPQLPLDEQIEIASVIENATHEINRHEEKLNLLIEQKKGLMQQLLTGQKRVTIKSK